MSRQAGYPSTNLMDYIGDDYCRDDKYMKSVREPPLAKHIGGGGERRAQWGDSSSTDDDDGDGEAEREPNYCSADTPPCTRKEREASVTTWVAGALLLLLIAYAAAVLIDAPEPEARTVSAAADHGASVAETGGFLNFQLGHFGRRGGIKVLAVGGTAGNLLMELREASGHLDGGVEVDWVGFLVPLQRRRELAASRELRALTAAEIGEEDMRRAAGAVCESMARGRGAFVDGVANLTSEGVLPAPGEAGGDMWVRALDPLDWEGGGFCDEMQGWGSVDAATAAQHVLDYVARSRESLLAAVGARGEEAGGEYDLVVVYEEVFRLAPPGGEKEVAGLLRELSWTMGERARVSGVTVEDSGGKGARRGVERAACAAGMVLQNVVEVPVDRAALRRTVNGCRMDSFAGLFTLGGIVGSEEERKVCDVLASVAEGARGLAAFTLARQPLAETARACRFRDGKAEL